MTSSDSAGVRFPPPLIFLGCLLAGYAMHRAVPVAFPFSGVTRFVGPLAVALSVGLVWWAFSQFGRHQTDVRPDRPTSNIIQSGPYHYTRNPIYVAGGLLAVGISLVVDSVWMAGSVVAALTIVRVYVIRREEAYLERKFGEDYLDYKRSVRRWA